MEWKDGERSETWWKDGSQVSEPQRTEPTDDFFNTLRGAHSDHWIFQDSVASKRLKDLLRDAQSAQDTTPDEDARLNQGSRNRESGMEKTSDQ